MRCYFPLPMIVLTLILNTVVPCDAQSDAQKLFDSFYPTPDKVRVVTSEQSPVVRLEPYVSLNLGRESDPMKWIVNKKPPVYVGQLTTPGTGAIIAVVVPPLDPQEFNSRFEAIMRKKFRVLTNPEFTTLTPVRGHSGHFQMQVTGTVSEGKRKGMPSFLAGRLVYTDRFCIQFQCIAESEAGLKRLTSALDSLQVLSQGE